MNYDLTEVEEEMMLETVLNLLDRGIREKWGIKGKEDYDQKVCDLQVEANNEVREVVKKYRQKLYEL